VQLLAKPVPALASMAASYRPMQFQPGWTSQGYTIGWGMLKQAKTQDLLNRYYTVQLNQQEFAQLRHQLSQLNNILENCGSNSHLSGTLATIRSGRRVSATG